MFSKDEKEALKCVLNYLRGKYDHLDTVVVEDREREYFINSEYRDRKMNDILPKSDLYKIKDNKKFLCNFNSENITVEFKVTF